MLPTTSRAFRLPLFAGKGQAVAREKNDVPVIRLQNGPATDQFERKNASAKETANALTDTLARDEWRKASAAGLLSVSAGEKKDRAQTMESPRQNEASAVVGPIKGIKLPEQVRFAREIAQPGSGLQKLAEQAMTFTIKPGSLNTETVQKPAFGGGGETAAATGSGAVISALMGSLLGPAAMATPNSLTQLLTGMLLSPVK